MSRWGNIPYVGQNIYEVHKGAPAPCRIPDPMNAPVVELLQLLVPPFPPAGFRHADLRVSGVLSSGPRPLSM